MLEKKGKGRGIKEVEQQRLRGQPGPDGRRSTRLLGGAAGLNRDARSSGSCGPCTWARSPRRCASRPLRITDVRVRYPDALRFGRGRFDPDLRPASSGSCCRRRRRHAGGRGRLCRCRAGPDGAAVGAWPTSKRCARPTSRCARTSSRPSFVTAEHERRRGRPGLGRRRHPPAGWPRCTLPPGYRWELGGHYLQQQEAFRSLRVVMVVAVLLVFIMLAFQFRSVVLPLLIFLTQPLSLVSGLFALWLTNTPLNVSSYMGAILLIGLDMKNGILLVEYIQQLRDEGMELRPALLLAGPDALPADPDDEPGGHPGPVPAGAGHRARGADAAAAGDHGHRRPDGQHAVHPHGHPGRLSGAGRLRGRAGSVTRPKSETAKPPVALVPPARRFPKEAPV